MQQRSQIPEADDKTTIKALIKGLTPGPTASHLTRKKPKTVEELFRELDEYILSDDDHRKRVAERNEARQGNRDMTWGAPPQHPRNVNNVGNSQPEQSNRPSTWGGFNPRGRGRGRGPPGFTNHNPKDPNFYCQYHGRGHSTEGCPETKKNMARVQQEKTLMSIASSMPSQFRPNFWQPQFANPQSSSVSVQQFPQPQSAWQPSQQFFPQSQNLVNLATTTHSGNLATTSRNFVKASVKFGTSELQGIAIVRDNHANHGRISYGIQDQEAEKQLLQVCKHHHQRRPSCSSGVGKGASHFHGKRFQAEIRDSQ
jgi:hypothetical protein